MRNNGGVGGSSGKGSNSPYKHCRIDPQIPNQIVCKDKKTGKKIIKSKPADWDVYNNEFCGEACQNTVIFWRRGSWSVRMYCVPWNLRASIFVRCGVGALANWERRMESFSEADKLWDSGNYNEAFTLFNKLAENGDVSSMSRLAVIYTDGRGVETDIKKSIYWDMRAIENGCKASLSNLAITYRMRGDIKRSKTWFQKAVDAGDGDAALELAKLYMVSDKETDMIVYLLEKVIHSGSSTENSINEAKNMLPEFLK